MNKTIITDFYKRATTYVNDVFADDTSYAIINDFVDTFMDDTIDDDCFEDLFIECVYHINKWGKEDITLDEYVCEGEELVEEISGTLGAFLDSQKR